MLARYCPLEELSVAPHHACQSEVLFSVGKMSVSRSVGPLIVEID
jgi:hypothetical protein